MKWLNIEYIKLHSRIEIDCEDTILELYGEAAEEMILNIINRSYDEIISEYGEVPAPLYMAALLLVDNSYTNRSPVSPQNLYLVPYGVDALLKSYMKLTY